MTDLKAKALKLLPDGTDPDTIHKVTASQEGLRVQLVTGNEITLKADEPAEVETTPRSPNLGSAAAAEERRLRVAAETTPTGRGDEATGQNYGLVDEDGNQKAPVVFPESTKAEVDFDAVDEDDIVEVQGSAGLKAALEDPTGSGAASAAAGYNDLNAKEAIAAIRDGTVDVHTAESFETAREDGGRKTVLKAIDSKIKADQAAADEGAA